MKEYKTMYKVEASNGRIEEIAVSMITKDGWIKYYPIKNGKPDKISGLYKSTIYSTCCSAYRFSEKYDEAISIAKGIRLNVILCKLEKAEEELPKHKNIFEYLKNKYLSDFNRAKDYQEKLEKSIAEYKKQIEDLEKGE